MMGDVPSLTSEKEVFESTHILIQQRSKHTSINRENSPYYYQVNLKQLHSQVKVRFSLCINQLTNTTSRLSRIATVRTFSLHICFSQICYAQNSNKLSLLFEKRKQKRCKQNSQEKIYSEPYYTYQIKRVRKTNPLSFPLALYLCLPQPFTLLPVGELQLALSFNVLALIISTTNKLDSILEQDSLKSFCPRKQLSLLD